MVRQRHWAGWLVVWLWLLSGWAVAATTVVAELDRNPVALGEAVVLRLTANGVVDSEPDFAPLRQDFEVAGTAQSHSFSMVNGRSTVTTVWELTLYPKRGGKLTIPALDFGNVRSQSLDVQVLDQPPTQAAGTADAMVELVAEPQQPYVQQQVLLTQRLLYTGTLQAQASLSQPQVETGKASIQALGDARHSSTVRDGRTYQVIERRYALFPQQSGTLGIGRTVFEGRLEQAGGGNRRMDSFALFGKPLRRVSKPLVLQVQAQPAGYRGKHWLPARSLTLSAHWSTPPDQLKAGEPVTLTIGMVAEGLTAEQLPPLEIAPPADVKAYLDAPELRNDTSPHGVVGLRQEKWVVVVPYNGTYTFPAVEVAWWDVPNGKQATANLAATRLVVGGGQAAPTHPSPTAATPTPQDAVKPAAAPLAGSSGVPVWLIRLLLIVVGLVAAWLLWRLVQMWRAQAAKPVAPTATEDKQAVWQRLAHACQHNQPQQAYHALLHWLAVDLRLQPSVLHTLYQQADANLQRELDHLNAALYGKAGAAWQGTGLLTALQALHTPTAQTPSQAGRLQPLYPE